MMSLSPEFISLTLRGLILIATVMLDYYSSVLMALFFSIGLNVRCNLLIIELYINLAFYRPLTHLNIGSP